MRFRFVSLGSRAIVRAAGTWRESGFQSALRTDVGNFNNTGRSQIELTMATEMKSVWDSSLHNLCKYCGIRAIFEVVFRAIISFLITSITGWRLYGILKPVLAVMTARTGVRCG